MAFSKDDIEKLIVIIKDYPIMCDMTLPEFKDMRKKDYLWDNVISQKMNGEQGDFLKLKWKYLRENYQKYLRSNKTTTGQAASTSKGKYLDTYKNWQWSKYLEFLKPHLSFASTMSNVQVDADEISLLPQDEIVEKDLNQDLQYVDNLNNVNPAQVEKRTSLKRKAADSQKKETGSNVDRVLEHLNKKQKTTNPLDAVEMLMMSHAKTIKSFSPKRQVLVKKQISEIIQNFELEQIDEDEYNNRYLYRQDPIIYEPQTSNYVVQEDVVNLSVESSNANDYSSCSMFKL